MAKTQCRLVEELGWVIQIIYCHGHNNLLYSFGLLTYEIKYVCNLVMLRLILFLCLYFSLTTRFWRVGKGSAFCVFAICLGHIHVFAVLSLLSCGEAITTNSMLTIW